MRLKKFRSQNTLFSDQSVLDLFDNVRRDLKNKLESLDPDYVVNTDESELSEWLLSEYGMDVPRLHPDQRKILSTEDDTVDVSWQKGRDFGRGGDGRITGTKVVIAVPFDGEASLFAIRPSMFTSRLPQATVDQHKGIVKLTFSVAVDQRNTLQPQINDAINLIEEHLKCLRRDVASFEQDLVREVPQYVSHRRKKLIDDKNMIESLGIQIEKRENAEDIVPLERRNTRIQKPKPAAKKGEPFLEMAEYEEILRILRSMTRVMEYSPDAFREIKEEHIRFHFLVQLNGQYKGRATGETFNAYGKADIVIKEGDKNLFIAECKIWEGKEKFLAAIDQLLERYVCWRDTKVALLVFNRRKNFTKVVTEIRHNIIQHALYERKDKDLDETTSRYIFRQPNDPDRKVVLTVMAFDIPK